ncbi:MAG: T9SS type A sorting domain-containing protein [Calditrichaeota bacterium]|nr:T9SS type A sorting domain-containing protein [Calditrichota bacterium]
MRNPIVLFTILLLLIVNTVNAQPDSLWSSRFGGRNGDYCYSMIRTDEGDFILAGTTRSFGAGRYDMWLIKIDADGDSLWSQTYGGESNDECYSMIKTEDGGYALAGCTRSTGNGIQNVLIVKTSVDGDSLWSRTFGGRNYQECRSIIQTVDGGYVLVGNTSSFGSGAYDVWVVRINVDGDSLWSRTYGGENSDYGMSVIQTDDGGYLIAGKTRSFGAGSMDMWLIKINAEGDSLWSRTYGGEGLDYGKSVIKTLDDCYVFVGGTQSFGAGGADAYLVKIDAEGDSLWSRTLGDGIHDWCNVIIRRDDGGFVLAGSTDSFGAGGSDMWIIRTDADGDSLWSRTFGGETSDHCYSIIQCEDRGFMLAGNTNSFDSDGFDMWIVKTGPDPVSVRNDDNSVIIEEFTLLPAYPNPFNSTTTIRYELPYSSDIELQVFNTSGQQISTLFEGNRSAGFHSVNFNANYLPSGLYFVKLDAGGQTFTRKVMLLK